MGRPLNAAVTLKFQRYIRRADQKEMAPRSPEAQNRGSLLEAAATMDAPRGGTHH